MNSTYCTWVHMVSLGCTYLNLLENQCTWLHLVVFNWIWFYSIALSWISITLVSLGCTWLHLMDSWLHLIAYSCTWLHSVISKLVECTKLMMNYCSMSFMYVLILCLKCSLPATLRSAVPWLIEMVARTLICCLGSERG